MRRAWMVALACPLAACSLLTSLDGFTSPPPTAEGKSEAGDGAGGADAPGGDGPGVFPDGGGSDAIADASLDASGEVIVSYGFEFGSACFPMVTDGLSATTSVNPSGFTGNACQLCATGSAGERLLEAELSPSLVPAGNYVLRVQFKPSVSDRPPTGVVKLETDYPAATTEPTKTDSLDNNWKRLSVYGAVQAGAVRVKLKVGSASMVVGDCLLVDDVQLVRQ